jgi:hypothetical protein
MLNRFMLVPSLVHPDEMHWNAPVPSAANGSVFPRAMLTHTACGFGRNKMVIFGGYDGAQEFSDISVMQISEDGCKCFSEPVFTSLLYKTVGTRVCMFMCLSISSDDCN